MSDEVKAIELWPCGYNARGNATSCRSRATIIARSVDAGGRPLKQYALCQPHADQVANRELAKGRQIIHREVK